MGTLKDRPPAFGYSCTPWRHDMRAQPVERDLQSEYAPFDLISSPTDAPLVAVPSRTKAILSLRHLRRGLVVGRQKALGDPAVGRRHRSDAGQRQLLRQAVCSLR